MKPDEIELNNLNKSFEYVKLCKDIDTIEDIEELRNLTKCFFKMYLKQQEVVIDLGLPTP
jgi:hypothetical protein